MESRPAVFQVFLASKDGAVAVGVLEGSIGIRDDKWNPVYLQQAKFRMEELLESINGEKVLPVLLESADPF